MRETGTTKLNERVARLESDVTYISKEVDTIRNNDLPHIDSKLRKLDERFDTLDKKVGELALKVGIVVAVLTTIGQILLKQFLK